MSDSYEQVLAESQVQWHEWLDAHHDTSPGIWLVTWKKASGRPLLSYDAIVDEALCYGWVDGMIRSVDEESYAARFTPRRPGSSWAASNRARIEKLKREGRLTPAGLAVLPEDLR